MTPFRRHWVPIALIVSFLSVGVPYWLSPYNRVNLPSTLIKPGLVVVGLSALLLRSFGAVSFVTVVALMGATVPAAVLVRVFVETRQDPTSHNLWPSEVIIALVVGLFCALSGAIVGNVVAQLPGIPASLTGHSSLGCFTGADGLSAQITGVYQPDSDNNLITDRSAPSTAPRPGCGS